jgi:hypothetical protein
MSGRLSAISSDHHHLSTTIIHPMPPLQQSKHISKRAADQDASKISTRSTRQRNAAAAPAASVPTSTGANNTTLDAAASIININDGPLGMGENTTTQDAAASIININDAPRPPNAKSFQATVNELRSRLVPVPLNVRQRMLSCGLNPKSNEGVEDTQASHPGVREDVAAAATTAAYSERYRSESKNDNNSEGGGDTGDLDYGDSFSVCNFEGGGVGGRRGGGDYDVSDESMIMLISMLIANQKMRQDRRSPRTRTPQGI